MLLFPQLFQHELASLLPILNVLNRYLLLFNLDLLLDGIKSLIFQLLLIIKLVHPNVVNFVDFVLDG